MDADLKQTRKIADSRRTAPDVLTTLATHADAPVRRGVAGNPNTPPDVLASLADDPAATVPKALAANPATPVPTLVRLLLDFPEPVMELVVERPDWPVELQWAGARGDAKRRWKTARRRDLAPEVVAHLAADDDEMVLLSVIGWHGHDLPTEVIDRHAASGRPGLRAAVAEHTRTRAVLDQLLTENLPIVLSGAVKNPLLSTADLTRLVRAAPRDLRYNGSVLFALGFAPNITPELREEIARLEERRPFV